MCDSEVVCNLQRRFMHSVLYKVRIQCTLSIPELSDNAFLNALSGSSGIEHVILKDHMQFPKNFFSTNQVTTYVKSRAITSTTVVVYHTLLLYSHLPYPTRTARCTFVYYTCVYVLYGACVHLITMTPHVLCVVFITSDRHADQKCTPPRLCG